LFENGKSAGIHLVENAELKKSLRKSKVFLDKNSGSAIVALVRKCASVKTGAFCILGPAPSGPSPSSRQPKLLKMPG
jgi:hypothetical protein